MAEWNLLSQHNAVLTFFANRDSGLYNKNYGRYFLVHRHNTRLTFMPNNIINVTCKKENAQDSLGIFFW